VPTAENRLNRVEAALSSARNALRESDLRFRTLADAFPHIVWSTLPDGYHDYYNARWYAFTGTPPGTTDGEGWKQMFHPDDQEDAWARWRHSLATGEPYEVEYRLRHHSGEYRWMLGRALPMRDEDGAIVRWIGTCTDIHEHKTIADQNEILGRELSHRIKNIFSVIASLIGLSARRQPEHAPFASALNARIAALGRAHELVRPHSARSQPLVEVESLKALIDQVLSPYPALAESRIIVSGDDFRVDDRAATPIGLVFHELATNAVKYGAMGTDTGQVAIDLRREGGEAAIEWRESEGPPIAGPPAHEGFGTRLAELSIVNQLGGTIAYDWAPNGLVVRLRVPVKSLAR
jgi:PAS domain S-box-containing protein